MAAVRDPNILEIAAICEDNDTAFKFAKTCGLVVDVSPVGRQNAPQCTFTPGCTGEMYHAIIRQLPKIRCNRCKRYRSAMNGLAVFGITQQTAHSWLVNVDGAGRPQTKLQLRARLLVLWCWAKTMSQTQTKDCLNGIMGTKNDETTRHCLIGPAIHAKS